MAVPLTLTYKDSIMSAQNIYSPYYYRIKDKITGKFYSGAKWEEGCSPSTFWVDGGYFTSSNIILDLIKESGPERFEVVKLIPMKDSYSFETRFLKRINAAKHPMFYNGHNNTCNVGGWNKGISYKQKKIRTSPQNVKEYKCPKCGTVGFGPAMKGWHFENCGVERNGRRSESWILKIDGKTVFRGKNLKKEMESLGYSTLYHNLVAAAKNGNKLISRKYKKTFEAIKIE